MKKNIKRISTSLICYNEKIVIFSCLHKKNEYKKKYTLEHNFIRLQTLHQNCILKLHHKKF